MVELKSNNSLLLDIHCSTCGKVYDSSQLNTFASCGDCTGFPLISSYSLSHCKPEDVIERSVRSMWRYAKVLPMIDAKNIISLGEGWTPILPLSNLSKQMGFDNILLKDESLNPTNSFKARGLSVAISKAKEYGVKKCIVATAGNAGGSLAAYCAKAGIEATVVMPAHTPEAFKKECRLFGAKLILVDGLINDCGAKARELNVNGEYFDVSTMKEPYRLEGKKTMGYEIAEQLNFELPEVILYPTGGGTGLLGIWKALHEMIEMGWLAGNLPRLIAVQSENCKPVVDKWNNKPRGEVLPTIANGLAVPTPFADKLIQKVITESKGLALSVTDEEIIKGVEMLAKKEGIMAAPEGGALVAALNKLVELGQVDRSNKILFLNTGSAYKYFDSLDF